LNILFIMCDQLRWDYLSCYGHSTLHTPNIDGLARRGVMFTRAFTQAPLCGPARMSFYTGRYMASHGSRWNNDPLRADEWTMGDYLRLLGMRTVVVGKTHHTTDVAGMARLGIDAGCDAGVWPTEGGFEPFERDDGLHPASRLDPQLSYNRYLRARGYAAPNPWLHHANSSVDEEGKIVSGWNWRSARYPANIAEEDSETPYMTRRAIEFIETAGQTPWCLHLSYIKPHWPYVAPAPYHDMYGADAVLPPQRNSVECETLHPVTRSFMALDFSRTLSDLERRAAVVSAYMGLVRQIDDQVGRLLAFLQEHNLLSETMIVFTSDHGDNLGDHWLGEKDLFYEPAVRIPLIIYDPAAAADSTRGQVCSDFVEAIDLLPTFIEAKGGAPQAHRLEGRSLLPLLHGLPQRSPREFVISESDFADREARSILSLAPELCRMFMIRTERWKYILHEALRPQLFDLQEDPQEFYDLGVDPGYATQRRELREMLFTWLRRRKMRTPGIDSTGSQDFAIGSWK
jgi:arylsulfatase A-like enzyme